MRRIALGILAATPLACGESTPKVAISADTLRAELRAEIGASEHVAEQRFGQIVGVAVDPRGVVYIADALGSSVRAYTLDGEYVSTIGTEGDGPGEFRRLLGLDIDAAGHVIARGAFRLSYFAAPSDSPVADSLVRTVHIEGPNPDRDVPGRAVGSAFFGPSYFWEAFERRGYFYLVYDSLGSVVDTAFVPGFPDPESTGLANFMVSDQGGRNVPGINRTPFEARPTWDVTETGNIVFTTGDSYEVLVVSSHGDTVRVIPRETSSMAVPSGEHADSAAAFGARLDSLPVGLNAVRGMSERARRRELPDVYPAILSVQVGEASSLWVRRWPAPDRSETRFDVFDDTGLPTGHVVVPTQLSSTPIPWVSTELIVGVMADPLTGVQRVGIFRVSG